MSQTLTGSRTALMTTYRQEYIAGFERGGSLLRNCVTTEHMKQGNSVVFLVADTGSATPSTRGSDGLYPARVNNNNQTTLTLADFTDLPRMNDFDIFSSQGPQREIMFKGSQIVIGRKVDDLILEALDTGTLGTSATASTDSLGMFLHAQTALENNNAGQLNEGDLTAVVSPAFFANLAKTKEFNNSDYVEEKIMVNGVPSALRFRRFYGVNIIKHSGISGVGTNAEKCFMFHKNAVGHAIDKETFNPMFGFNEEQNYSWVRCSSYMAAAKLQNTGIMQMYHDGSTYAQATV